MDWKKGKSEVDLFTKAKAREAQCADMR